MEIRRLNHIEQRECSGCGRKVPHVALEHEENEETKRIFMPAKTHKAPCGLWCASAADAVRPTRSTHGHEGHCKKCGKLKPPA